MPAVPAERLLISALVNGPCVGDEVQYAITETDFLGYSDEYTWLVGYVETYGCQPTADIFRHKFPDFMLCEHTDVRSAADMVHQVSNRRRLTTAITEASDLMHLGEIAAAHQTLVAARPRSALAPPRSVLTDSGYLDRWLHRPYTIELPYPSLQRYTGGIEAGNLWYVAGRPGQGKSAHLAAIAVHAIMSGNRVLFYSLEMSESEVRARFHAAFASILGYPSITLSNLRIHNVEVETYRRFLAELATKLEACGGALDVHTPADGPVSPSVVAARCGAYQLTCVDYVSLMAQDGGGHAIDDWRVMAKISNSLKAIALSQDTAMLCAAQINRDGDNGSTPPKLKNLSQSDALGQDGDVVLTMRAKPKDVATHFSLEKNRHGSSGMHFYTSFSPNTGTYTEISAEHAEDLVINAEELATNPHPPQLRIIKSEKDT